MESSPKVIEDQQQQEAAVHSRELYGKLLSIIEEESRLKKVTTLDFGEGIVGADDHLTESEAPQVMQAADEATVEHKEDCLTCFDCMDGRELLKIITSDTEITDPEVLIERVVGQLAGGTGLAFTKAMVAANAKLVEGAKTFEEAYDRVVALLSSLGIRDTAHEGCGASKLVQTSVEQPLSVEAVAKPFGLSDNEQALSGLKQIAANKAQKVAAGFYRNWTPELHKQKVLANGGEYHILETADDATKGHHEAGVKLTKKGFAFMKNLFIRKTEGKQLFNLTLEDADVVVDRFAGETEETRELIKLSLRDDSLSVANHIVAPGLDVFA